jgi:hypothetical protein
VALFVSGEVQVTSVAFIEFDGLLNAGHATQSQCWADASGARRISDVIVT